MNFPTGFGKIFCLFLPKTTFLRVFSQKTAPKNAFFIFLHVLRETHFAFFCESHFAFSFFSFSLKIHTILFLFFFPPVFPVHLKTAGFGIFFAKCLSETLCFSGFFFFSVFFTIKKNLAQDSSFTRFFGYLFLFLFLIIHALLGRFFCFFQMKLAKKCQKGVAWNNYFIPFLLLPEVSLYSRKVLCLRVLPHLRFYLSPFR